MSTRSETFEARGGAKGGAALHPLTGEHGTDIAWSSWPSGEVSGGA